ncbi:PLDc N-terminal domain-containing protein [Acrocarpospora catenulata]|uniref:PLDc N-terminal domain-containing protein n=1 Tax=Acrocarpospora catenulata TaxID=2836182 RepID=UPI001BD949CB|nr:PLDc N-terminal domain-containing protein [Acrocarpospora catenulata]
MLLIRGVIGLVLIGLWVYCVLDVITTQRSDVRTLPKLLWLVVVLLLPLAGSLLWLIAGRPRGSRESTAPPAPPRVVNPDDDEEFLRQLRQRAEEQRRAAREQTDRERPERPKASEDQEG